MNIFTRPPQLTTAVTDFLISIAAADFILRMKSIHEPRKNRRAMWEAFMWIMLVSGAGGFLIHGFNISAHAVAVSWILLALAMFATASMFAMVVFYELYGDEKFKKVSLILVISNISGYTAMLIASLYTSEYLRVFGVYAGILIIVSLCSLLFIIIKRKKHYCWYLVAGAIFQIAGGIIAALRRVRFTLIWEFDFNSIYHFATIASILCFLMAYKGGAQYYRGDSYIYARKNEGQGRGLGQA